MAPPTDFPTDPSPSPAAPPPAGHRILAPGLQPDDRGLVEIDGPEARHALGAKRLGPGDAAEILDGQGRILDAVVVDPGRDSRATRRGRPPGVLVLRVLGERTVEPASPRIEVCSAVPKGDRLSELIDGLSQAGAAAWHALACERSVVPPAAVNVARLERIARESSKQSGRAWILEIGAPLRLDQALDAPRVILADAGGPACAPDDSSPAHTLRLLIGPEGGWTARERDAARRAGASIRSFGPHVMRIETAAVVAVGVLMALAHATTSAPPRTIPAPPLAVPPRPGGAGPRSQSEEPA